MQLTAKFLPEGSHTALPSKCADGGVWCLVKGNGELALVPTTYGDNPTVKALVRKLAELWNDSQDDRGEGFRDGLAGNVRTFGNFGAPFKNYEYEQGWKAGNKKRLAR